MLYGFTHVDYGKSSGCAPSISHHFRVRTHAFDAYMLYEMFTTCEGSENGKTWDFDPVNNPSAACYMT